MLTTIPCLSSIVPLNRSAQLQRDPLWKSIQAEALAAADREPIMRPMLDRLILNHRSLECALVYRLAEQLTESTEDPALLRRVFAEIVATSSTLHRTFRDDLQIIRRRDPAVTSNLNPFLNFKGFQALQASRMTAALWRNNRKPLALYLQGRISTVFGLDVHPAAKIGQGVFLDHASGIVIGETARVGNNVVILHDVTLGATGNDQGDRHPKVDDGVFIGAGAKILGNIRVGSEATIGAGSIVLKSVPSGVTVAGIPARIVRPAAEQLLPPSIEGLPKDTRVQN